MTSISFILEGGKYNTIETDMSIQIHILIVSSFTIQMKLVLDGFHFRWLNIMLSEKEFDDSFLHQSI